jgi:WD40 repeat protein
MKYPVFFLVFLIVSCTKVETTALQQWQHVAQGSYAAEIADNGKFAVVSSVQNGIAFWDLQQNALTYQWQHQQDQENLVFNLALSPDNSHVLSADQQNFALWRTDNGANVGFWQIDQSSIRDIAVSNNGAHLLIGKSDGAVQHITLASGRRLEFLGHTEKINSVALSPNGRYALTGSNDYQAYLWDTDSAQIIHTFSHPSRVSTVALDPQGRFAFTADSQSLARIWDVQTGALISSLQIIARQQVFSAVRFSADGKYLLTGAPTRNVVLWRVSDGKELQRWRVMPRDGSRPAGAVVHAVAFLSPTRIISESSSGYAEVWEINYE